MQRDARICTGYSETSWSIVRCALVPCSRLVLLSLGLPILIAEEDVLVHHGGSRIY